MMSINPTALTRIAQSFSGPADGLGERVTRTFLEVWEGAPTDSEPLLAMLRGAITNEQATTQLREFIEARLHAEVPPDLRDDPTGRTRVGLASSMFVGVIVLDGGWCKFRRSSRPTPKRWSSSSHRPSKPF